MIEVNYNDYKRILEENMKLIPENHKLKEEIERLGNELQVQIEDNTRLNEYIEEKNKEVERLNNRLKTSNDTCNYLRNTIDKAIFFIQNQELHKSKDTTGAITMKERELIDILLGSDSNEQ